MEFVSKSPEETKKIASDLAHQVVEIRVASPSSPKENNSNFRYLAQKIIKTKKGTIIAMEGELGAGKTTFIQGFMASLGIDEKVKSPTFVLMKKYVVPKSVKSRRPLDCQGDALTIYHLDCYRIADHKDLKIPELEEILNEEGSIVFIEWAERIKEILPKNHITVHIDHISEKKRKIIIS